MVGGSYGTTQVPALQRMAIRILTLTSSSSGCERNWSCFEGVSFPTFSKWHVSDLINTKPELAFCVVESHKEKKPANL